MLTLAEFEEKYDAGDCSCEYWRGRAVGSGALTSRHGIMQCIVDGLLGEVGYVAALGVELRIAGDARPKPDVIATKSDVEEPYPTKAVDVVVEILSADDAMGYVIEKCRAYEAWGIAEIYVVDPESRLFAGRD